MLVYKIVEGWREKREWSADMGGSPRDAPGWARPWKRLVELMSSSEDAGVGARRGPRALHDGWGGATQMEDRWAELTIFLQAEPAVLVRTLGPTVGQSRGPRLHITKPGLAVGQGSERRLRHHTGQALPGPDLLCSCG